MVAYCIFDIIEVTDPEKMAVYGPAAAATVEKYGGRYLARGGNFDVVEGDWQFHLPVILEFESLEKAHEWYDSEDYREPLALRQSASRANGVFIEGL